MVRFVFNLQCFTTTYSLTAGDGNDYVQGFNETSTLQIGGTNNLNHKQEWQRYNHYCR